MNPSPDLVGGTVGVLLTALILSYIIGDNPLYRLALHVLVGATVGYGVAIAATTVLLQMVLPALQGPTAQRYGMIAPLVLGLLLLFKGFPRWAAWGNFSTAFLIGVGAAVATGGALLGTILPQAVAAGSLGDWLRMGLPGLVNGLLVIGGTVCALVAFTFAVPRRPSAERLWKRTVGLVGQAGRLFLLAAFGTAFAAALTASLTILVGRIYYIVEGIQRLLLSWGG